MSKGFGKTPPKSSEIFEIRGIRFMYLLTCFTDNFPPTSKDLYDPSFDIRNFDIEMSHTPIEWQSLFFHPDILRSQNEVRLKKLADSMLNVHDKAFKVYLRKKVNKNLVIVGGQNVIIL